LRGFLINSAVRQAIGIAVHPSQTTHLPQAITNI